VAVRRNQRLGKCPQWLLAWALALTAVNLQAQIYTCAGADGSRVFSDSKCGDDATAVKGFENTKRKRPARNAAAAEKTAGVASKIAPKSPVELADLLKICNAGDMAACKIWTLAGGPNALREAERNAELACEAGSLTDCEERYCKEGANEDCRQRVLRSAPLSGDSWYLRQENPQGDAGSMTYAVRCISKGVMETRDVTIMCASRPSAQRCFTPPQLAFERLTQTATNYCR
jgi:hypothetical protein